MTTERHLASVRVVLSEQGGLADAGRQLHANTYSIVHLQKPNPRWALGLIIIGAV